MYIKKLLAIFLNQSDVQSPLQSFGLCASYLDEDGWEHKLHNEANGKYGPSKQYLKCGLQN